MTAGFALPAETGKAAESGLPRPNSSPSASAREGCWEAIELGLSRGRNGMAIWRDSVSDNGFASGDRSVARFAGKLRGAQSPEAHVAIETAPGEEAQVDYGAGPMVRAPGHWQVPSHAVVRDRARLQPPSGPPCSSSIRARPSLFRTPRESVSPAARRCAGITCVKAFRPARREPSCPATGPAAVPHPDPSENPTTSESAGRPPTRRRIRCLPA